MARDILLDTIRRELPDMELREGEILSAHCSFRIGGPARGMALPRSEDELVSLLRLCRSLGEEPLLLGRGTNMLFADSGTRRLVVKPCGDLAQMRLESGTVISAGCAVTLAQLACFARDNCLAGLEFAHGIPGTLGGAVVMNAGAYGGEMKDVLLRVRFFDDGAGEVNTMPAGELELGYRTSRFSTKGGVVISAELELRSGVREEIDALMRSLMEKRRASQPLDKASAGSTFKRPREGYAAALIDGCGLKGRAVGAAQVSPKHAGFIVNNGGASCGDVLELMRIVQDTVQRETGTRLEPEVKIIES